MYLWNILNEAVQILRLRRTPVRGMHEKIHILSKFETTYRIARLGQRGQGYCLNINIIYLKVILRDCVTSLESAKCFNIGQALVKTSGANYLKNSYMDGPLKGLCHQFRIG